MRKSKKVSAFIEIPALGLAADMLTRYSCYVRRDRDAARDGGNDIAADTYQDELDAALELADYLADAHSEACPKK